MPPEVEVTLRGIFINGRLVPVADEVDGESADAVVCVDRDQPTPWEDDIPTSCAWCGRAVKHRPAAPKSPPKICVTCAIETRQ